MYHTAKLYKQELLFTNFPSACTVPLAFGTEGLIDMSCPYVSLYFLRYD